MKLSYVCVCMCVCVCVFVWFLFMTAAIMCMGWLQVVGSLKLQVSFANEPYKRDDILQKRPIILSKNKDHDIFFSYGVATSSRLLKIVCLFCRILSLL